MYEQRGIPDDMMTPPQVVAGIGGIEVQVVQSPYPGWEHVHFRVVTQLHTVVQFGTDLLEGADGLFLAVADGQVIVTAGNGRWKYRPIGSAPGGVVCALEQRSN